MADSTVYSVTEVGEPSPLARARAWLRGRIPTPPCVTLRSNCPHCGGMVTSVKPRIRQGAEYSRGIANWKDPDELVGFELAPCGHSVEHYVWTFGSRVGG